MKWETKSQLDLILHNNMRKLFGIFLDNVTCQFYGVMKCEYTCSLKYIKGYDCNNWFILHILKEK